MELPFTCDYSKSSRAVCRGCQNIIMKDTLRLAIMLQATGFDGKTPNWYHSQCFFLEHMPQTIREIEKFDSLKWEDQREIENILEIGESPYASKQQRSQLKRDIAKANSKATIKNYFIEYTKIRQKCDSCNELIKKSEIRICRTFSSKKTKYHLNCFQKIHESFDFLECGNNINGFNNLSEADQKLVKLKLPGSSASPPKKERPNTNVEPSKSTQEELLSKDYNKIMDNYRTNLKENLTKSELISLLTENGQVAPPGFYNILERVTDMLTYGALTRCINCRRGQLEFSNIGYKCTNSISSWVKCNHIVVNPNKNDVYIPEELRLKHTFLYEYNYVPRKRIILQPKSEKSLFGPLCNKTVILTGFVGGEAAELRSLINNLGGRVISEIFRSVFCIVTNKEEVLLKSEIIKTAEKYKIYVVNRQFLDELISKKCIPLDDLALKHSLVPWGSELHNRIPNGNKFAPGSSFRRGVEEEAYNKRRMKIKNGIAIEPGSGLDEIAHVYQSGAVAFNAVLSKTEVTENKNSYYKIQLLESDNFDEYWLYTSWGRIGTSSGSQNVKKMETLIQAKKDFEKLFKKMTGNTWKNRYCMVSKPFCYTFVDVNYEASKEEIEDLNTRVADSNLKPAVAQLMAMIFNVQAMEKMMLEYELDMQKMPLGKLSRTQIRQAYNILTQVCWIFQQKNYNQNDIIEYTNKFYSYMPHLSSHQSPPLIDNIKLVKEKSDMLANLMEMETAFSIIQRGANGEERNPIDAYYSQLKTTIEPLEEDSEDFKLISKYVHNTHGDTHRNYDLNILEIFRVARDGETERYQRFSNLHNRQLLWHGSRITNFAGILSQGLRIAPPEAPTTGYMFGKGIYFADMVSKSANYCCTTPEAAEGLVLLCEVALGNIEDKIQGCEVKSLPADVHSVRGVGGTQPNPQQIKTLDDGVQVPFGTPVKNNRNDLKLLYNEYIVYDIAQVKIKYLLKLDFKYKH